jgi:hypothetical protein
MLRGIRIIVGMIGLLLFPAVCGAAWFDPTWSYRVPIIIPAGTAVNSTIKVDVDFSALLATLGVSGTFDVNSPRIVRPNDTLSLTQEFTDTIYAGATDAAGNARGEVQFILEDAGPSTYYLYFDIVENGAKAANPQTPINGNFERGGAGTQSPPGWTATKSGAGFDAQVRPSETPTITTDSGSPNPVVTDGTPFTGTFSYLLGARTNVEPGNAYPAVTLSRSIAVPAVSPGNIVVHYRPEGWDSSDNGAAQWDFVRIRLVGTTTTEIVGPTAGNYVTYPFSPNKGTGQASNANSGYGQYNGWDNDLRGRHRAGMTLAVGSEPWFTRTYSLAAYAGQTITLQITANHAVQYKSWTHIDDVAWSVVAASLGTPEARVVLPGRFNAYEPSTPVGAIAGVIKTKVSAQLFNLDLIAINTAYTAIEAAFTGDVKVELLNASNNSGALDPASQCRSSWSVIGAAQTVTFAASDSGRKKNVAFNENNAWPEVRVRISYPATGTPTVVGCSSDAFAIRPAGLTLSATDNNWQTAGTPRTLNNTAPTGGVVHKAGQPFTLASTAVNVLGNVTTNYAGNPTATATSCAVPAGCTAGTVNPGVWAAANGVLTSNTASYSEAGVFTLQLVDQTFAAVDAADSTPSERYITSASINVGRFVPDHFDLAPNNTPQLETFNDATCAVRSFTYIGQPFGYVTAPQALVTARSAAGGITTNYRGSLWQVAAANVTQSYTYVLTPASTPGLDTGLIGVPVVTSNNNGTGAVSANSADTLAFNRSTTTPQVPFTAAITLTMDLVDPSENAAVGNGIIATASPAVFNGGGAGIAFDSGNAFRYGILRMGNAHGSELLPLPVPMEVQYWTGTLFATNTADNCTLIAGGNIALSNYQKNLQAGETNVSISGRLAAGKSNLTLTKPAGGDGQYDGSVDLTVNLSPAGENKTYLQGRWLGTSYDKDPGARATFGIYRKANEILYMREIY